MTFDDHSENARRSTYSVGPSSWEIILLVTEEIRQQINLVNRLVDTDSRFS